MRREREVAMFTKNSDQSSTSMEEGNVSNSQNRMTTAFHYNFETKKRALHPSSYMFRIIRSETTENSRTDRIKSKIGKVRKLRIRAKQER